MTIKKSLVALVVSTAFCCLTVNAEAQGIPVYDNTANIKLIEQYLNSQEQLGVMVDQYEQGIKEFEAMTGTRHMGSYANTSEDALLRRYTPDNMQDFLDGTEGGMLPPGIAASYNQQQERYQPLTASQLNPDQPQRPEVQAYEQQVSATFAANAASEAAYNNAANNLQTYEGLLNELDGNTPDLKASVDLQTRANIQNGLLMNEILKQNALLMQLRAAENTQNMAATRQAYDSITEE